MNTIIKKYKKIIIFSLCTFFLISFITWIVWSNTAIELNEYTITSDRLPNPFNGYRIAHVSDLHNTEIGTDNEKVLTTLHNAEPDIIVITGDLIDSRNTNMEIALNFIQKAVQIAPCYYVIGNHEARIPEYSDLEKGLKNLGVIILNNKSVTIERSGQKITLIGLDDPSLNKEVLLSDAEIALANELEKLAYNLDTYSILLSHRPDLFDIYSAENVDLVFSGHAHGGQFRLPFIGGLAAPNQGLFPKYDAGVFTKNNTNMIVSRGIGNSRFPFRFNNRPEIVLIELESIQ